ncbi:MAG TPA: hypothetical protein VF950_19650 [Planctomycetota bacterium]
MPEKRGRRDSSLHGFPLSPGSTPWGEILPDGPGAAPDRDALHGRLVVLYGRFIHQFFKNVLGLKGDALKDATQDFFLHVLEKESFKGVRTRDSFRGFLRLACRRFYLNRLAASRAGRRDVRRTEALAGDVEESRFFELYDREERNRYLEMAVEAARDGLRRDGEEGLLELLKERAGSEEREGEDYAALAAKHGLSVSDVRNRLAKARRRLREALLALAQQRSPDPEAELRELGLHRFLS